MTIEQINIKDLVLSPLNVRTNVEDATDIEQLACSIEVNGLLQPLVVHKLAKGKKYGVIAGGRRLRALEHIKFKGEVPCRILDSSDSELVAASITENFVRKDMRPYEIYQAFAQVQALDPEVDDVKLADIFGLPVGRARRILRLAHLHPDVFAAYAAGKIDDDTARAYAATEDQELQLAIFKTKPYGAFEVKQALRVGLDTHTLDKVGRETYEAAGGRVEEDLFSDNIRVLDTDLLARLNVERLEKQRADIVAEYPNTVWSEAYPGGHEYSGKAYATRIYGPEVEKDARMLGVIALGYDGDYKASFFTLDEGEKVPDLGDKQAKPELTQRAQAYIEVNRHGMLRAEIMRHADYPGRWRTDLYLYTRARQDGLTSVSFEEFVATNEAFKDETAAALFARLIGGGTDATKLAVEHVGHFADSHARELWTPDAEFFDLFKKPQLLEIAAEIGGLEHYVNSNMKLAELKERLLNVTTGTAEAPSLTDEVKAAAQAWVPKWLRFEDARASVPAEQSEAEDDDEVEDEDLSSNEYPGAVTDPAGQFESAA